MRPWYGVLMVLPRCLAICRGVCFFILHHFFGVLLHGGKQGVPEIHVSKFAWSSAALRRKVVTLGQFSVCLAKRKPYAQ